MVLLAIKNKIFDGLERPVRRFLASDQANVPIQVEYYAGKNYEQLFEFHLNEALGADDSKQQGVIDELDSGAEIFARKIILALYSQWSTNQLPKAVKKIANHSAQYPLTSEFLMSFFERYVASVDVVDDFGESAFVKLLKNNSHQNRPLLFLMNHGAKHNTLSAAMQDSLRIENPEIYDGAESNTTTWMNRLAHC